MKLRQRKRKLQATLWCHRCVIRGGTKVWPMGVFKTRYGNKLKALKRQVSKAHRKNERLENRHQRLK